MEVGQQSKQNRVPSPQMAKRSYTYNAIMRLNNIENCLIDMQRSRDDIMSNIGQILEREKSKLVVQREKSSSLLRLSRYNDEIADQSKALEEDRQRITSLRENIHSRRAALEEAKKRYQTGNEYLEMVVLKRIAVLSEALFLTTSKLCARQKELVADLLTIFPIEPIHTETFSFKILGVPLPNSVFTGCDDEKVATALGFTCHLINMLAYYLGVPLRFPIIPMSSRSTICDPITAALGDSRQFPLYAKGADRYRFEYAVFLLNKNIEQLMNSQGLTIMDLRHTLPNLKYLILSLISTSLGQSSASHLRKSIPHNCTIPHSVNNTIASTSDNQNRFSEEEEGNSLPFPNTSNSIKIIDPSKRSLDVVNTLQRNKKNTTELHRKTSQGFKVGVT